MSLHCLFQSRNLTLAWAKTEKLNFFRVYPLQTPLSGNNLDQKYLVSCDWLSEQVERDQKFSMNTVLQTKRSLQFVASNGTIHPCLHITLKLRYLTFSKTAEGQRGLRVPSLPIPITPVLPPLTLILSTFIHQSFPWSLGVWASWSSACLWRFVRPIFQGKDTAEYYFLLMTFWNIAFESFTHPRNCRRFLCKFGKMPKMCLSEKYEQ